MVAWDSNLSLKGKLKKGCEFESNLGYKEKSQQASIYSKTLFEKQNQDTQKTSFHIIFINRKLSIFVIKNKCFKCYYMYKYSMLIFRDNFIATDD